MEAIYGKKGIKVMVRQSIQNVSYVKSPRV